MFRPKHTLESVAAELARGLDSGEIVLNNGHTAALATIRSDIEKSISKLQFRVTLTTSIGFLASLAIFALNLLTDSTKTNILNPTWWTPMRFGAFIFAGVVGFFVGRWSGKRIFELKTYLRILDSTDTETATRIAPTFDKRIRHEELVA